MANGSLVHIQREAGMGSGFYKTITIMAYQLGDLAKSSVYGAFDKEGELDLPYKAEARLALADLVTQCRVVAELLGTEFAGLVTLGQERFEERAQEYKAGVVKAL